MPVNADPLDGTETMAEYLDPIIVSVAVMDRDRLEQTRAECLPLVRLLRNRFWRLWLRNRFAYVSVFGFYLLLVGGAIRLWIGNSHSLSIWSLLIAGAISLLITWFFISHAALNHFFTVGKAKRNSSRKNSTNTGTRCTLSGAGIVN